MNFLAHAHLSFNVPPILAGNMASDFVKGKKQFDYTKEVQQGIRLHRMIDDFTDTHPATHQLKQYFRPQYRLYAGAFVDVAYDYFLANDKRYFADAATLKQFTTATYISLQNDIEAMPAKFQQMFPYMRAQDWLYNYQFDEGIKNSFGGLVRRAAYLTESEIAFRIFLKEKQNLQACYHDFYPSLHLFAQQQLQQILNT